MQGNNWNAASDGHSLNKLEIADSADYDCRKIDRNPKNAVTDCDELLADAASVLDVDDDVTKDYLPLFVVVAVVMEHDDNNDVDFCVLKCRVFVVACTALVRVGCSLLFVEQKARKRKSRRMVANWFGQQYL